MFVYYCRNSSQNVGGSQFHPSKFYKFNIDMLDDWSAKISDLQKKTKQKKKAKPFFCNILLTNQDLWGKKLNDNSYWFRQTKNSRKC